MKPLPYLWIVAIAAWLLISGPCRATEPSGEEVLNAVGIRHGLVVQVGGTDHFGHVQARLFAYRGDKFVCVGGTDRALEHRGGPRASWVRAFERKPALEQIKALNKKNPDQPINRTVGAEMKWHNPMPLTHGNGTETMIVAGDKVLVGISVLNNDQSKEKQRLPYRLLVLGLADGTVQQELPLPAKPILGGISAAAGRIYVTTADGLVTCFTSGRSNRDD